MTLESIVTIAVSSLGFLFGGGVWFKHNASQRSAAAENAVTQYRLKVAEEELKTMKETVSDMSTKNAVVHSKVEAFERHLEKLDMIPDIAAKLNATVDAVKTLHEIVNSLAAASR